MTSRLPVTGLETLPANLSAEASVYVKPLGHLPSGKESRVGKVAQVEVLVREVTGVLSVVAGTDALKSWSAGLTDAQALAITRQIEWIGRPLSSVSGLDMDRCHVMGIINVTPDSFSDGGQAFTESDARARGRAMVEAGASLLDVGGESTRPGSEPVPATEEFARVVPAIEGLVALGVPISIDSRNTPVMAAALDAGAAIVNDISALTHDPSAVALVARHGVPVVLMHAQGDPRTMQEEPVYDHVSLDVYDYLHDRIQSCVAGGIERDKIIVDPGIGFGKTLEHNLILLRDLALFQSLGCPILLGASRKSFISRLSGGADVAHRLGGSLAAALGGARAGARFLRVHDVVETVQAVRVWRAIEGENQP